MCGFIASITSEAHPISIFQRALIKLRSRGPDGEGIWHDGGVFFGHRRLSILDLDSRSLQPLESYCGRFVIIFNGEIYNYMELREDCESQGWIFKTYSDTEVILAMFYQHREDCLNFFKGMFSFVIWDKEMRSAFIARDPYGIKPLYFSKISDGIIFCSQIKALISTGLVPLKPNVFGQMGFWLLGSVPGNNTWYENIYNVPPGFYMKVNEFGSVTEMCCWNNICDKWLSEGTPPLNSQDNLIKVVRHALKDSIRRHIVSDVPIGIFLSGGIDSACLAALMLEEGVRDLHAITVVFSEFNGSLADETEFAQITAKEYGLKHTIRTVMYDEFISDLPAILESCDQPTMDGINTWYASKAAAELGLKVVVSGIGADEIFQGYDNFKRLPRIVSVWNILFKIPFLNDAVPKILKYIARSSNNNRWLYATSYLKTIFGAWILSRSVYSRSDLVGLMGINYSKEVSESFKPEKLIKEIFFGVLSKNKKHALSQMESSIYLRNQLLKDSDWASMAHGVELRTPFVDSYLLSQLSPYFNEFRNYPKKALIVMSPKNSIPKLVATRRKAGFGIPIIEWLKKAELSDNSEKSLKTWMRIVATVYDENNRLATSK